jgi:hypothetical protein
MFRTLMLALCAILATSVLTGAEARHRHHHHYNQSQDDRLIVISEQDVDM